MKVMTAAELAAHKTEDHGRLYPLACDGYEDMELAEKFGWSVIPAWGYDGWDLGNWPYVSIYTRDRDGKFEMQQIVEGDHTVYSFESEEQRNAAIDYLFIWYAAANSKSWSPVKWDELDKLNAGEIEIAGKWRGPYRPRTSAIAKAVEL